MSLRPLTGAVFLHVEYASGRREELRFARQSLAVAAREKLRAMSSVESVRMVRAESFCCQSGG